MYCRRTPVVWANFERYICTLHLYIYVCMYVWEEVQNSAVWANFERYISTIHLYIYVCMYLWEEVQTKPHTIWMEWWVFSSLLVTVPTIFQTKNRRFETSSVDVGWNSVWRWAACNIYSKTKTKNKWEKVNIRLTMGFFLRITHHMRVRLWYIRNISRISNGFVSLRLLRRFCSFSSSSSWTINPSRSALRSSGHIHRNSTQVSISTLIQYYIKTCN